MFRVTSDLEALLEAPFHARWVFDVEILARIVSAAKSRNSRPACELIYEYPLDRWQDVSGSRLKPFDFVVAAFDLAAIYWRFRRGGAVDKRQAADADLAFGRRCRMCRVAKRPDTMGLHGRRPLRRTLGN